MRKIKLVILFIGMFFLPITVLAQNISDYLILQDINGYKMMGSGGGQWSGILVSADHFGKDHSDESYEGIYFHDANEIGVTVQVTQHAGAASDKWLLHELERGIRRGDYEENMTPSRFRNIDGNNIFYSGLGGGTYRWISNNKVINIEYTDLYKEKQEPLEVVKAYLSKFPSTISAMAIDQAHNVQWLKDEMERRLWLCDKWSMQLQLGKVSQADMLNALVKHMTAFLYYRQKYYGVSADKDLAALQTYFATNDGTSIKKKLDEYKTWWTKHKDKKISL